MTEPRRVVVKMTRSEWALLDAKINSDHKFGRQVDPILQHVAEAAEITLIREAALEERRKRELPSIEGPKAPRRDLGGGIGPSF